MRYILFLEVRTFHINYTVRPEVSRVQRECCHVIAFRLYLLLPIQGDIHGTSGIQSDRS
jgi:hypothetical protein